MVSWGQQVVRGALYGTQFTAAFRKPAAALLLLPLLIVNAVLMLLGMYFNGYSTSVDVLVHRC